MLPAEPPPRLTALLGPTNTGKTRYAIDRMLEYGSGMIGFPLRLLARENYDRVVSLKGAGSVALVTGEEKIVPPEARFFVCTVESMPIDRTVDFLAVDEIQMCADPERGHVFTDRLLYARGRIETLFLGAETMRPLIRSLVPGVQFTSRQRLSRLSYSGPRKITRLKRRSAVVAFSVNEVYAFAELMRRQRGGTALVLGALSPRTRNAQVNMYQEGEVEYLIATDAIGMGLNMNIDHVALASTRKFDGRRYRQLSHAEVAQIAGRSGRYLTDGTFGPIAEIGPFSEELVSAVEEHRFDPVNAIYWRNSDLAFRSLTALQKSLETPAPLPGLVRARDIHDQAALAHLARNPEVTRRAMGRDRIRLLWEVCQIPDFRKTLTDVHADLLCRIFCYLSDGDHLPVDRVARQIARLDRVDGDIDTLMSRIAHVRTWTYIAYRSDWLSDSATWQARTRDLEDKLSDVLHERLTQRFVDRRATILTRARDRQDVAAVVDRDDEVTVGGEVMGTLEGFRFLPDPRLNHDERRSFLPAVNRALGNEIETRIAQLMKCSDRDISIRPDGYLEWENATIARLTGGSEILTPSTRVLSDGSLTPLQRGSIRERLDRWIGAQLSEALGPLFRLRDAELQGLSRGIAYRIVTGLGSFPRRSVARDIYHLTKADRGALRSNGVVIGTETLFIPSLVKPGAVAWRALLWAAHEKQDFRPPPAPGLVSVPVAGDMTEAFLEVCGYRSFGQRAVRIDVLDRVATELKQLDRAGNLDFTPSHRSLTGLSTEAALSVMTGLGYETDGQKWRRSRRGRGKGTSSPHTTRKRPPRAAGPDHRNHDEHSPFAKLRLLQPNRIDSD